MDLVLLLLPYNATPTQKKMTNFEWDVVVRTVVIKKSIEFCVTGFRGLFA